ncbi:MAG: carboxypeptidase-like regulatory domain-containing protein [bacterium]|nr:carboxypeptidase-like regulatory domain-containing protein [bacterium]
MNAPRGMSLVDVIVGIALILIVFLALLGLLRASLLISSSSKAKAGGTAVATTQMEYIRSLSYDNVGTLGGIPAGPIAQYATTTMNGIPYGVRTLIQYVDDPKDGFGAADSNGITTDYKRVRIAATYQFRGEEREIVIVSNVVPPSIETTAGGGTLRVNVVNAVGGAVAGASVHIENSSVSPAIDLITFSDSAGSVSLPGAPTSTDYRITVTKDGYSTAQTYARDVTNQNPTPGYLTVSLGQTTTSTFAIDVLSSFTLRTFEPIRQAVSSDTFTDASNLEEMLSVQVSAGALMLAGAPGSYAFSGSARSITTAPVYLAEWTSIQASVTTPAATSYTVSVTDSAGGLIPDAVIPGNSIGFTTFPIDLTGVSTSTYPGLALRASLASADGLSTPSVESWQITFEEGPLPLPNVPFTFTGAKRKGTTGAGDPLYKTIIESTTDVTGNRALTLEWDVYTLTIPGYSLVSPTSTLPHTLEPGMTTEAIYIIQ